MAAKFFTLLKTPRLGDHKDWTVVRHGPQGTFLTVGLEGNILQYIEEVKNNPNWERWDLKPIALDDWEVQRHFTEQTATPSHSENKIYGSDATMGAFYNVVEPVMEFINNHFDPHTRVIIDTTSAEILSGIACHNTMKFVKD